MDAGKMPEVTSGEVPRSTIPSAPKSSPIQKKTQDSGNETFTNSNIRNNSASPIKKQVSVFNDHAGKLADHFSNKIHKVVSFVEKSFGLDASTKQLNKLEKDIKNLEYSKINQQGKIFANTLDQSLGQKVDIKPLAHDYNQIVDLKLMSAKLKAYNEAHDMKFFEPENLSLSSKVREKRNHTQDLQNKIDKEIQIAERKIFEPALKPGVSRVLIDGQEAKKAPEMEILNRCDAQIKILEKRKQNLEDKNEISLINKEIENLNIKKKKTINSNVSEKLQPKVADMQKNFASASATMQDLHTSFSDHKSPVDCKNALDYLANIDKAMDLVSKSTSDVVGGALIVSNLLKKDPTFNYNSLTDDNKAILTSAVEISRNMDNAVALIHDACRADFTIALGPENKKLEYKEGMIVVMQNPLLNCEIKVGSKEELDKLNELCDKYVSRLDFVHKNIPDVYRKFGETTFNVALDKGGPKG